MLEIWIWVLRKTQYRQSALLWDFPKFPDLPHSEEKKNTCIMRIKSLQLVQHHCYFEVTYWQTLCFQYNWYMWSCVLNSKPHCLYWWTFFDTYGTMKCIDLSLTAIHTFRILLNILHKICFMFVCVFFSIKSKKIISLDNY